ncbi:hypothetical protein ACLOJK_012363 [Asimina triloba]
MAARFLWRASYKLAAASVLIGGGATAAKIATSDDPSTTFKICTTVPVRLFRDSLTAALIAFDYEYSLWGLPEGSAEYSKAKHEVHLRAARRLRDLCFQNGGIYIKLGQHIGQLEYLVPQEFVQTMRESMLNRCPVSSYDQVCEVFRKELGGMPNEIFIEFDPVPLASASLAQVHAAHMHDGRKVAVKVQHAHMTDTAIADTATVEFIVNVLHRFFPSFDYRWLVDEIRESLPKLDWAKLIVLMARLIPMGSTIDIVVMLFGTSYRCGYQELDFLCEAKNSERCMDNFKRLSPHLADYVYAPKVYWNLSTSKLLTMEFMDAAEITDVSAIQRLGIQPKEVAKLGQENHSWYYLTTAIVFADASAIKENSVTLGAGEDLYALFAGMLTMRPWNRVIDPAVDHLVLAGDDDDRSEMQMYASQYFPQISELLSRLPRVILLLLKTNDCLRAVNYNLLQGSSFNTILIVGRVSSEAVCEAKMSLKKSIFAGLSIWLEEILLEARLLTMQIALWLLQLRRALSV